ncbi:MAG: YnbE family lipoprotein [Bacteriovoracaceae bacterium]|jgi:hypothetical protein|nr:YnbE family lipoprotein [Bacteriovoracaceae bacterium]
MKILLFMMLAIFITNCAPTITVAAPDKPIEINLNVKIDHNIKVKVDKELDSVMKENEDIF